MDAQTAYEQAIHNVSYHKVRDDRQERMEVIREKAKNLLTHIAQQTNGIDMPRELQMSYRAVEDAVMYAIAGIARHGEQGDPTEKWG